MKDILYGLGAMLLLALMVIWGLALALAGLLQLLTASQGRLARTMEKWRETHMLIQAAEYCLLQKGEDPGSVPVDFFPYDGYTANCTFRDAENLWDGPQFPMDAIDVNGRVALTIACSGIDARVARDVHKYSESPLLDGKGSYIYSLAVNFLFKGIGTHWTITLDDVTTEGDWSLVSVCNGRYYGGGFMPVAEARMDDGVLNTLVVREVNRRTFLKFVGPYSRGEYAKFPEYAHCSCPKVVHIHSEKPDIVTCLDGESVVNSDVTIKLHDKKLNFFGPEGCSCNRTARG